MLNISFLRNLWLFKYHFLKLCLDTQANKTIQWTMNGPKKTIWSCYQDMELSIKATIQRQLQEIEVTGGNEKNKSIILLETSNIFLHFLIKISFGRWSGEKKWSIPC